jgi:hypothetical protein
MTNARVLALLGRWLGADGCPKIHGLRRRRGDGCSQMCSKRSICCDGRAVVGSGGSIGENGLIRSASSPVPVTQGFAPVAKSRSPLPIESAAIGSGAKSFVPSDGRTGCPRVRDLHFSHSFQELMDFFSSM